MKTTIKSLHSFFSGEEKEVWVQNISSPQGNVVVTIDPRTNDSITIPKGMDPLPLTERFTFEQLKKSRELRQLVDQKKYLRLLTEEDADSYYKKKGKGRYDKVQQRASTLENKIIDNAIAKNEKTAKEKSVMSDVLIDTVKADESPIPPSVVSLDNQFANKMITDVQFIDELEQMESDLMNDEILSFLTAKTRGSKKVKAFVKKLQKQMAESEKE